MQKIRRSNNSRELILDAAQKVAVEKGAGKVSLDSVAKEAGLTKGGVLYNFSSKEALVSGMLERLINTYTPRATEYAAKIQDQPNPTLQSAIHVIRERGEVDHNISMAILAAAAHNLNLLIPLRNQTEARYEKICSEADSADEATLLWAAGEGLVLMDMLGLLPFDSQKKAQLLEVLELKAQEKL